nr:hypothetical protein [Tanacetum cinerariifolium]
MTLPPWSNAKAVEESHNFSSSLLDHVSSHTTTPTAEGVMIPLPTADKIDASPPDPQWYGAIMCSFNCLREMRDERWICGDVVKMVVWYGDCWSGGGGCWCSCLVTAVRDGDDEDGEWCGAIMCSFNCLREMREEVLVRSGLSSVWFNKECDQVFQRIDDNAAEGVMIPLPTADKIDASPPDPRQIEGVDERRNLKKRASKPGFGAPELRQTEGIDETDLTEFCAEIENSLERDKGTSVRAASAPVPRLSKRLGSSPLLVMLVLLDHPLLGLRSMLLLPDVTFLLELDPLDSLARSDLARDEEYDQITNDDFRIATLGVSFPLYTKEEWDGPHVSKSNILCLTEELTRTDAKLSKQALTMRDLQNELALEMSKSQGYKNSTDELRVEIAHFIGSGVKGLADFNKALVGFLTTQFPFLGKVVAAAGALCIGAMVPGMTFDTGLLPLWCGCGPSLELFALRWHLPLGFSSQCGKTTTQNVHDDETNAQPKEPLEGDLDKPVKSNKVLTNNQPQKTNEPVVLPSSKIQSSPVPFPRGLRKEKEVAQQMFMEDLKQLHFNLPFIKALAQMMKYAKFLKGLLKNKAKLKEACKITMNERCSVVLLNKLPSKEKDPRSFTIPCDIGQLHIDKAIADLGASISLMPYMIYKKLGLGEPKATRMSLELADRILSNSNGFEGSRKDNLHLSLWDFRLPTNAIWIMQCSCYLSKMHDDNLPRHGKRLYGSIHG